MNDKRQLLFDSIIQFHKSLLRARGPILKQLDLTAPQAELLTVAADGAHIGQLAEMFSITSSAITQLVETLEQKGLVERRRSDTDKRAVEVHITPAGRRLIQTVHNERCAFADEILHELTDQEIDIAFKLHQKASTKLQRIIGE